MDPESHTPKPEIAGSNLFPDVRKFEQRSLHPLARDVYQ
jgi:hypothetical protein